MLAVALIAMLASVLAVAQDPDTPLTRMVMGSLPVAQRLPVRSLVRVRGLDVQGNRITNCAGFISASYEVTTAFACVANSQKVEVEFSNQRRVGAVYAVNWDRARRWIVLSVATAEPPLIPGNIDSLKHGDDLMLISDFEGRLQVASGRALAKNPGKVGLRVDIDLEALSPLKGGPVLNAQWEVVGILTDSSNALEKDQPVMIPLVGPGANFAGKPRAVAELAVR